MARRAKKPAEEIASPSPVVETAERPRRRIRRGPLSLARELPEIMRPAARRFGFPDARIFSDWPMIMGQATAFMAIPLAIKRDRLTKERTLVLRCTASNALHIQHLAPLIIERLNTYYGFPAIKRLQLRQGPLPPAPLPPRPRPPLPPEREAALQTALKDIESDTLRRALEALGRAVLLPPSAAK